MSDPGTFTQGTTSGLDRRVSVRLISNQETPCHYATLHRIESRWAKIHDLSREGIALLLQKPFSAGQTLFIEVPTKAGDSLHGLTARVVHARLHEEGNYLIGCVFLENLNEKDYQALL